MKDIKSKIKKILNASIGAIYGVGFGATIYPSRLIIRMIQEDIIPYLRKLPEFKSILILPFNLLSLIFLVPIGVGVGIWYVGINTAIAWHNKGWNATTAPNRLTTIHLTTPTRNLQKAKNTILYVNEDELLEDAIAHAISMSTVIKQQSKSLPIEITALITEYLGVEISDSKIIEVDKKRLNEHVRKTHSSNLRSCHRFFSFLEPYRKNIPSKNDLSLLKGFYKLII